ncbi:MAG: putative Tat (twin-arginine translocation) pathway signal sequence [Acidimicrobiales bacterium]|nr:putative Tat (twin-arginine translocation) pathway signal sequence [Acidimicrobiales bacterium]
MTIEDRLRDAIADHVAAVSAPPDDWVQIEEQATRIRGRVRLRKGALTALGLVAATVAGVLVIPGLLHDTQRRHVVTRPSVTTAPVETPTTGVTPTTAAAPPGQTHWVPLAKAPIAGRISAGSVWTGRELLIFGGVGRTGAPTPLADGAAYQPSSHSWRRIAPPPAGVLGDVGTGSAWTGKVAVFWAGNSPDGPATGAVYDPAADSWRRLPDGPLRPREGYASVWTGTELVIVGGTSGDGVAQPKAAALDPATVRWRQVHGFDSFPGLLAAGAVWTGHEVVVAGTLLLCPEKGSLCRESRPIVIAYDPARDAAREVDLGRAQMTNDDKKALTAVGWTGKRVLLSSAAANPPRLFTYEPGAEAWRTTSAAPCQLPDPAYSTSKWTGDRYAAACGRDALQMYDPSSDRWQKLSVGPSPMNTRSGAVVAWTGRELIAWSGGAKEAGTPTPADGAALALTSASNPPTTSSKDTFAYVPLWPFRSQAEADAWRRDATGGHQPWHLDPDQTALSFTQGFLGFSELNAVVNHSIGANDARVSVGYDGDGAPPLTAAVIHLVRFGSGADAPWEVVGTDDTDMSVKSPSYGTRASSPLQVGGTVTGVDENIRVQVRQPSSANPIGEYCCLPAGGTGSRWDVSVTFTGATDPGLTIVAFTGGHRTAVERFAVTGVRPAP